MTILLQNQKMSNMDRLLLVQEQKIHKKELCQLIIMWNMISRLMENFISQKDILFQ